MKYLAVGDVHIDINNRMDDIKETLDQIATIAINEKVDKLLFLGDAFTHRRPYPEEYNVLYNWVMKIKKEGIPIILLRGNHDQQKDASTLDAFEKLQIEGVKIVDTNHIEDGIFMGHFIIQEAVFNNSNFHIDNAITVEQLTTRYKDIKLFLMGDIHKPQQVNEEPPIYYIGSIDRNNFGERENEPRVLLIKKQKYSAGADEVTSLPLKVRPMIQATLNAFEDILSGEYKNYPTNFTDALVKVVIKGTEDDLKKVSVQEIREFCKKAKSLSIQFEPAEGKVTRDLEMTEEVADEDALKVFLKRKHSDLPTQDLERIFEKGKLIIVKSKEKK